LKNLSSSIEEEEEASPKEKCKKILRTMNKLSISSIIKLFKQKKKNI